MAYEALTLSSRPLFIDRYKDLDKPGYGHRFNFDEFIKAGRGDFNYVNARFKCKKCGGAAEKQIRPPTMEPVTRHTQKTRMSESSSLAVRSSTIIS